MPEARQGGARDDRRQRRDDQDRDGLSFARALRAGRRRARPRLAAILSSGKTSRLYKSLVYDKSLAQSVARSARVVGLSSQFTIEIMVRPGVSPDAVEKADGRDPRRGRSPSPPAEEELKRAKNQIAFDFVDHGSSRSSRARALLNMYWAEKGDPGFVNQDLRALRASDRRGRARRRRRRRSRSARASIIRVVPKEGAARKRPSKRAEKRK